MLLITTKKLKSVCFLYFITQEEYTQLHQEAPRMMGSSGIKFFIGMI